MAKNISNSNQDALEKTIEAYAEQTYEGTFIGNLTGNADTATKLENAFTITVAGDASGSVSTNGSNATLQLKVTKAAQASNADHAKTADTVNSAETSKSAGYATTAGHAATSDTATNATNAEHAQHAVQADSASNATNANEAQHAVNADKAKSADTATNATTAEVAKKAQALENPEDPVDYAKYADKAGIATIAQYDCEGNSIKDLYAKKTDVISKDEAFTEEKARVLFASQDELLQSAVITGAAYGRGRVTGTTLNIEIVSVAQGESASFYNALVFLNTATLPEEPDTTKIYITSDGVMYLYSRDTLKWEPVKGILSDSLKESIDKALSQLSNYVDLSSNQTINGLKKFKEIPQVPISSITDDPDRNAVSLHNLREVQKTLNDSLTNSSQSISSSISELENKVQNQLNTLTARVDAQQNGDWLTAYIDYTIPANQASMVVGTTYVGLLEEDYTFIPINPATNEQVDPEQVPYWRRYYNKTSAGIVTWRDFKLDSATFTDYARLDGATFTGLVKVPNNANPLQAKTQEVLNAQDVRTVVDDLVEKAIDENNTNLDLGVHVEDSDPDLSSASQGAWFVGADGNVEKIFAKDKAGQTAILDLREALKANASFKIVTTIPEVQEPNVIYVLVDELNPDVPQDIKQLFLSDDEGQEATADFDNQTLFIPDATDTNKGVISKNEVKQIIGDNAVTNIPDATEEVKGILTLTTVKETANSSIAELIGLTDFSGEVFE